MLETLGIAALVMLLRATDVSIGTLRTLFMVEGRSVLAPALGFMEAMIFIIAASLVLREVGNPVTIFAYALGFAIGTALGMLLGRRLGLSSVTVRLTKPGESWDLTQALREASFRLTTFVGEGRDGPVSVIELNVRKRRVPAVLAAARPWLNQCFVTVGNEPLQTPVEPAVIRTLRRAPVASREMLQRRVKLVRRPLRARSLRVRRRAWRREPEIEVREVFDAGYELTLHDSGELDPEAGVGEPVA